MYRYVRITFENSRKVWDPNPSSTSAMGFPSSGLESFWRNGIEDVANMLNKYHQNHFKIWNLSGRSYDYTKFDNQVDPIFRYERLTNSRLSIMVFLTITSKRNLQFINNLFFSPPLALLFRIIISMHEYLSQDKGKK